METRNYYTPQIEEFHIGFEYEFLYNHGSPDEKWERRILNHISDLENDPYAGKTFQALENYDNVFIRNAWRVKYLDRQDIESLGWEIRSGNDGLTKEIGYASFDKKCTTMPLGSLVFDDITHYQIQISWPSSITIFACGKRDTILFKGVINNKSEFKRLMGQIGIPASTSPQEG